MSEPDNPPEGARTGMVLRDPLPWDHAVEVVRTAEEMGFQAVFVPESRGREAFATLGGFAAATSSIRLGTGVVTVRARTPALTAMAGATLHEASGGRCIVGIGSGTSTRERDGEPGGPPVLDRVRRYADVVRRAWAGETVDEPAMGVEGFRLDLRAGPVPPPLWLGALGDGMIRLAGEIADGVILNWCTPDRVAEARRSVVEAAMRAGRNPADVTVAVYVRACLGVDPERALDALARATGEYAAMPRYDRQMRRMGLGEESSRASRAIRTGRVRDVPQGLVHALTVSGGRDEWLARARAFHAAGADLVLCYPVAALEPLSSIMGTLMAAAPSPTVEG